MRDFVKAAHPNVSLPLNAFIKTYKVSMEEAQVMRDQIESETHYTNGEYFVSVSAEHNAKHWPGVIHLTISRLDDQPVRNWRDMQDIKNLLIGEEHEAIELYPAESRLVDMGNQYHLWVFSSPEVRVPVGWKSRMVFSEMHSVQD